MKEPIVWPGEFQEKEYGDEPIKDRDPTVPCPDCGNIYLYTDAYDRCYKCGRGIISNDPERSSSGSQSGSSQ